jgi:hypothetical protein
MARARDSRVLPSNQLASLAQGATPARGPSSRHESRGSSHLFRMGRGFPRLSGRSRKDATLEGTNPYRSSPRTTGSPLAEFLKSEFRHAPCRRELAIRRTT